MYYIYTDEAGISTPEPVTVVAAVIVNADNHWIASTEMIEELKDRYVPAEIRPNFYFHAKEIWSGFRDLTRPWNREDRAFFIAQMAAVPNLLGMAISVGRVRRDSFVPPQIGGLKPFEWQHMWAFWFALLRANKYVRDWGSDTEVATVVAERTPNIEKFLRETLRMEYPDHEINELTAVPTVAEKRVGKLTQTMPGKIDRIVDTVHFVAKDQAPILQIADACAFTFRRYFSKQEFGDKMVTHMLNQKLDWEDWQGPTSQFVFSFDPNHRYPKV